MLYLLEDKLETATMTVASPAIPWNIFEGKSPQDKTLPAVIFEAETDGPEEPLHTGNFWAEITVSIKQFAEPADPNAKPEDQAMVSLVFTTLMVEELPALLSAAVPDLYVYPRSCEFSTARARDPQGVWVDQLKIRCYACGSALAP
jgi:hypothetical protein